MRKFFIVFNCKSISNFSFSYSFLDYIIPCELISSAIGVFCGSNHLLHSGCCIPQLQTILLVFLYLYNR